jgi:hypothetical protein
MSMTSREESERIAELTGNAVRSSGEKVIEEVTATVVAAKHAFDMLQQEANVLIEITREHSYAFADRVAHFVASCQGSIDALQERQSLITNVNSAAQETKLVAAKPLHVNGGEAP